MVPISKTLTYKMSCRRLSVILVPGVNVIDGGRIDLVYPEAGVYVFVRPEGRHLFLTTDACVTQKTQQEDLTTLYHLTCIGAV